MELTIIGLCGVILIVCLLYVITLHTMREMHETLEDNKILISHLFDAIREARAEIDDVKNPPAFVTDPFTKPKHIYQSQDQIIVPITPDEIRARNYKKIKEGAEYGSAE